MDKSVKRTSILSTLHYRGYPVKTILDITDMIVGVPEFVKIESFTVTGTLSHILTDPAIVEDYRVFLLVHKTYYLLKF